MKCWILTWDLVASFQRGRGNFFFSIALLILRTFSRASRGSTCPVIQPGPRSVLLDVNPAVVYDGDVHGSIDILASNASFSTGTLLDTSHTWAPSAGVNNPLPFNNNNGYPAQSQFIGLNNGTQNSVLKGESFGPYGIAADTVFDVTSPSYMVSPFDFGMDQFDPTRIGSTDGAQIGNMNLVPGDSESYMIQAPFPYPSFPDDMNGMMPGLPADMISPATDMSAFASPTMASAPNSRISCTICTSTFKRDADRIRHENSVHNNGYRAHLCPVIGCAKSQGRGFSRADKVTEHCWKQHGNLGYSKRA